MVGDDLRYVAPPLRLTRRGRAVILVFFVVLTSLASAVLFTTASRAQAPAADPTPTVVVQPGDTLWDLAARVMPNRDRQSAVVKLRQLNELGDYVLQPGDVLIFAPSRLTAAICNCQSTARIEP